MLRSCVCMGGGSKRRSSSLEDSSSCRSSEIERVAHSMETTTMTVVTTSKTTTMTTTTRSGRTGRPTTSSLLQLFQSKTWYRHWRKPERVMSMTKAERTIKSALLIQRWYRRYMARIEVRRRYTWTIFTNLEYAGENDQVELYNFFNALLRHIPEATGAGKAIASPHDSITSTAIDLETAFCDESDFNEEADGPSDKTYDGPHLKFPLNKKDINSLIDLFRKKKADRLLPKYVGGILTEAASKLRRLPNLNQASTAISKQVTVIGDLHGKLDDLLVIFHKNGLPSTENPYVFNGDFVDRGKKGLEVFLLLLASFLAFPGAVHLNRGNHEDSVMNARYGFIREVQQKYKHNSDKLLALIDEVYRWLPLGTIVNNRVLIVHGGISDKTDLDMLKSLDRGKYVSILRPPIETVGEEGIDKTEWKQIFDIMWSDPQIVDGCKPNNLRGAGTYFGPDVTETFLKKYKMQFIVRSHECKPDGHEFTHNGKVLTIFSASNYYAMGSNKGAYLKLNPHLDTHFVQYVSAASRTRHLTFREKVSLIEGSALRGLGARLRDRKEELEKEFKSYDPKNTGKISVTQWCEAMEKVTMMGLPWRLMRDRLAPMGEEEPRDEITYRTTLDLLDTDIIIEEYEAEVSVTDALYKNKSSLEAIFHILDKDHSGQISLEEFGEAVDLLRKHVPGSGRREELMAMCKMMDINKDGFVDLNEFLEAFRLSDMSRRRVKSSTPSTADRWGKSPGTKNPSSTRVAVVAEKLANRMSDAEVDIDPTDCVADTLKPSS